MRWDLPWNLLTEPPMPSDPLETALSRLPAESPFVDLLRDLASPDLEVRTDAYERACKQHYATDDGDVRAANWAVGEAEGGAILQALREVAFPPPPDSVNWKDGIHEVLGCLWRSPHPSLAEAAGAIYPRMETLRRRCAVLALLGSIGTREAAVQFAACVRDHGWPEKAYARVYDELTRLFQYSDVMLPDVLLTAGKDVITGVGDALLAALSDGTLQTDAVGDRLEALTPYVVQSLKKLLKSTAKQQDKPGIAWRFSERYQYNRQRTSMFLDLAGYLSSPKLAPLLEQALSYSDPRLVTFAALSRLRRGELVPAEALEKAAACHETRSILFLGMSGLGHLDQFPSAWCTWEAFGAAAMVDWLLYPTELGAEPDELELALTVWLDEPPTQAMHVWKFRVENEPWKAGVSGPYALVGDPQPLHGPLTFSRFDDWEIATPEQHLELCAGTVEAIREQS